MKKITSLCVILGTMFSFFAFKPLDSTAQASGFDEKSICLTFGAISDIHVTEEMNSTANDLYRNALQKLLIFAEGKLDAVTISGDICELEYSPTITSNFKEINSQELPDSTEIFFVAGNHDANSYDPDWLPAFFGDLSCYTEKDLPSAQPLNGNRHAVINGYHFIGVNIMDYYTSEGAVVTQENLDWLNGELSLARSDAPGKHIFLYLHPQIENTVWCSDQGHAVSNIYDTLKNYPEVVAFSGHDHTPNINNTAIHQKDFTSVNSGNVAFMCIEGGYIGMNGLKVDESYEVSNGMLAQVDSNGNLRLTRINFKTGRMIKEYIDIPAPDLENKTHLLPYNPDYVNLTNSAPVFPNDSTVSVKPTAGVLEVTFSAASDDEMVQHYEFETRSIPSGNLVSSKAYSDFWLYDRISDFPKSYTVKVPITLGGDGYYELKIFAVDSYGKKSEPIVYNTLVGEAQPANSAGGDLLNLDFVAGEARNAATSTVCNTTTHGGTVTDDYFGKYAYRPTDKSHVNLSSLSYVYMVTASKFTAEAIFLPEELSETQYIFGCEKKSKGYSLFINPDGTAGACVNTKSKAYTLSSTAFVTTGEINHLALSLSENKLTLFLNGLPDAETQISGNVAYTNTNPFVLGSDSSYANNFKGLIFQAGVYSEPLSESDIAARHQTISDSFDCRTLTEIFEELGFVEHLASLSDSADVDALCSNYAKELSAVIASASVSKEFIESTLRRDEFLEKIAVLSEIPELPNVNSPVVTGVVDGGTYNLADAEIAILYDDATSVLLNFKPVDSGSKITQTGKYQLLARNYDKLRIIEFEVTNSPSYIRGDLDKDGEITVADALAALRIAARISDKTEEAILIGDADGDGEISVADALAILRVAAKISTSI